MRDHTNEEVVENHSTGDAEDAIIYIEGEVEEDLGKEDADAEVDDEFDGVGAQVGEDNEGEDSA